MSTLVKYITVFLMSMLPIVELRGAVPYGVALNLPLLSVLAVCIIGNMLPIPFIILFIRRILEWMKEKSEKLHNIAKKLEARATAKSDIIIKYELFGLFLFVAIPLPGTGAWTGALIATLFNLRLKYSFISIFLGVITAGIIMSVISYGVDMLI